MDARLLRAMFLFGHWFVAPPVFGVASPTKRWGLTTGCTPNMACVLPEGYYTTEQVKSQVLIGWNGDFSREKAQKAQKRV